MTAALAVDPTPERAAKVKATVKARIAAAGAEWVREIGMRTDRAEAEFGPGWLDEE